jgi:hypothetical protein
MSFFSRVANLGKGLWKVNTRPRAEDAARDAALEAEMKRAAPPPPQRTPAPPTPAEQAPERPKPASDDLPRKRTL